MRRTMSKCITYITVCEHAASRCILVTRVAVVNDAHAHSLCLLRMSHNNTCVHCTCLLHVTVQYFMQYRTETYVRLMCCNVIHVSHR